MPAASVLQVMTTIDSDRVVASGHVICRPGLTRREARTSTARMLARVAASLPLVRIDPVGVSYGNYSSVFLRFVSESEYLIIDPYFLIFPYLNF